MEYRIPSEDSIISFWFPFFQALSIDEFDAYSWRWGIPIESSPELRSVAKKFTIAVSILLGYSVPDQSPENDLRTKTHTPKELMLLWQTAFSQLEEMNYNEIIINWYNYYDNLYRSLEPFVRISEWDGLLLDWARKSKLVKYQPSLPSSVRVRLQLVVLHRWFEYYKARDELCGLERRARTATLLDPWTQFVVLDLRIDTWLMNLGSFFAQISYWKEIFGLLTPLQITKLEIWGRKELTYPPHISLVELSTRLAGFTLK